MALAWRPLWPLRAAQSHPSPRDSRRMRSAHPLPFCPLLCEYYFFAIGTDREERLLPPQHRFYDWRGGQTLANGKSQDTAGNFPRQTKFALLAVVTGVCNPLRFLQTFQFRRTDLAARWPRTWSSASRSERHRSHTSCLASPRAFWASRASCQAGEESPPELRSLRFLYTRRSAKAWNSNKEDAARTDIYA